MSNKRGVVLGAGVAAAALVLGFAGGVYSQRQAALTLDEQLAKTSGVKEETVSKVVQALGPVVTAELKRGNQVTLPGLGTFRVVRIPEHKDLQNGRPVVVAASNYVEFLPTNGLVGAANSAGAKPAVRVPQFQYNPLPTQTPAQRTGKTRVPSTRSR